MWQPAPFQSPLIGLAEIEAFDTEVLGDAVEQPAGHPQLVGDLEGADAGRSGTPTGRASPRRWCRRWRARPRCRPRCGPRRSRGRRSRRRRRRSSRGPGGPGVVALAGPAQRAAVLEEVYSCSMPNSGSWSAYFSAISAHAARVLVGCGYGPGQQHLAQHEDVVAAADRVGAAGTRGSARSRSSSPGAWLVLRTVEAPDAGRRRRRRGSWSWTASAVSARCRRSRCTQPCTPRRSPLHSVRRHGGAAAADTLPRSGTRAGDVDDWPPQFPTRCPIVNAASCTQMCNGCAWNIGPAGGRPTA